MVDPSQQEQQTNNFQGKWEKVCVRYIWSKYYPAAYLRTKVY